jgi:hypothetical protein
MLPSFVICGIEHSGTTLLSDIFRQVPTIDSGFETGVLLVDSPREFRNKEPFISNLAPGWRLKPNDLDTVCDCDTFDEFYERLWQLSGVVDHSKTIMFDKTPRYFSTLSSCMQRIDCRFIASYKDPRAIVASDYNRAKPNDFLSWFYGYAPDKKKYLRIIHTQLKLIQQGLLPNALAVSLEDVCLNTRSTLGLLFDHVEQSFDLQYLLLKNLRYRHTKLPYISSNIPFQYLDTFNREQLELIEQEFSEFDLFFYR